MRDINGMECMMTKGITTLLFSCIIFVGCGASAKSHSFSEKSPVSTEVEEGEAENYLIEPNIKQPDEKESSHAHRYHHHSE